MKEVNIVKNDIAELNYIDLENLIKDNLLKALQNVPIISDLNNIALKNNSAIDILLKGKINNKKQIIIACEVRHNGEPRFIRETVKRLMLVKKDWADNDYPNYYVIAAPYISPASAAICKEHHIGFIDLNGNCLISFDGIYISVEGKINSYKMPKGKSSDIFARSSVKSSIILRQLLAEYGKKWKIQELAAVTKTSVGQIANVKKYLENKEYINSASDGFWITKPKDIIFEWSEVYNAKPDIVKEYYTRYSVQEFEQKLAEMGSKYAIEYAVTAFSGAVRYSPTVRYNKVHVYMYYQNLQKAIEVLGFKEVTSGANVSIIIPYDSCVMLNAETINQLKVVSPVQICLDLLALKGRGEEAATAIMEKVF